jgi:TRAP-type transport system periplasmic protein
VQIRTLITQTCGLALLLAGGTATAQEATLKAVNAFQEGTYFAKGFERFVKKVNDEGKGIVQINYIGGPKAIPTFEQPNALRAGVVDMANTTSSFTAGLVPDGLALNYTRLTQAEMRKNGIFDQINASYADKGLFYYARTGEGIPYHLYLNKKIDSADLSGLKIRVAPIYRDFLQKQNATVVQMAPGEVFTALERGVVDGYAWPLVGIFDLGWADKTKFRVDPGFYAIELGVVFNLASWNKLDARQKAYLQKQAEWLEAQNVEMGKVDGPADTKRQADAGIQVIKLDEAQSKIFLKAAYDGGWEQIVKASPVKGPQLRELMAPK